MPFEGILPARKSGDCADFQCSTTAEMDYIIAQFTITVSERGYSVFPVSNIVEKLVIRG